MFCISARFRGLFGVGLSRFSELVVFDLVIVDLIHGKKLIKSFALRFWI